MSRENQSLLIYEHVEFEELLVEIQDFRIITHRLEKSIKYALH
jgi:hypothetical protein